MAVFTAEQEEIIKTNSEAATISFIRASLPKEHTPSAALSEDTMPHLKYLLYRLSDSKLARSITFPDWPDNLATKLRKLADAWVDSARLPDALRLHLPLLLKKVVSEASELDIWATVVELLKEFDSPTVIPTEDSVGTTTAAVNSRTVQSLKNDWASAFIPDSLKALNDVILDFDKKLLPENNEFYARTLVFIQSSGMGKSRLTDTFGQSSPMINYVLREEGTFGYPPADHEILSLMREQPSDVQNGILTDSLSRSSRKYPKSRASVTWYHSLAVGLLQASFETLNTWVKERSAPTLEDLAFLMHEEMAHNSGSESLDCRPEPRIKFCKSVAKRAREIANNLINVSSWRQVFDDEADSAIRLELINKEKNHLKGLLEAVRKLLDNLNRFQRKDVRRPPLVVVFDEASSLLKTGKSGEIHSGQYIALNRIMSCLKESPIWFFIVSTESQVGTILPLNNARPAGDYAEDPSLRFIVKSTAKLKRIPPFLALRLDIQDRSTMQDPTRMRNELRKNLSDFGEPNHMAMFGRRLWFAYSDDPEEMNEVVRAKLLGGVQQRLYDPRDVNHVFAALSFRLSLDPCMHNSKTLPLIGTAVNSYMRVVISIDEEAETMHTITPSEPIVAKAAMEYLCDEHVWAASIRTLVRELFDKGLVDKGLKGELYARLLLVLAHDWVRCRQGRVSLLNREPPQEPESISSRTPNSESSPKFMKSFTVKKFLEALYVKDCHKFINEVDPQILGARMNFTHFVPTDANLSPQVLPDLLSDLLRRSAALQLALNQPTYDILLPIYFGGENEPLDPSKCGCVMIQVKNKGAAITPGAIFHEEFTTVGNEQEASDVPTKRKRGNASGSSTSRRNAKAPSRGNAKAPSRGNAKAPSRGNAKAPSRGNAKAPSRRNAKAPTKEAEAPTPGEAEAPTPGEAEASTPGEAEGSKKAKVPLRNGSYFVLNEMTNPILFLLFDLGITITDRSIAPRVEVSYSSNGEHSPRVWAIHSRGHDKTVFHCLELMSCEEASRAFFTSTVPGVSDHDILARRNETFYKLSRDFRYPPVEDERDAPVEDEGDASMEDEGDASMEDEGDASMEDEDASMEDEVDAPMEDEGDALMEDEGDAPLSKLS
ncbi:hypothetical protein V2W45_1458380 [Cenococcum geophilum]